MKRTEWAAALLIGALLIGCTGNEAKPAPVVTALPSATAVIATAEPTAEPVYYNGEAYPRDSQLFDRAWEEDLAAYAALAAFAEAHPEIVFSEQHPTGSDPASCRELTMYAPIAHLDALVRRLPGLETLTVPDSSAGFWSVAMFGVIPAVLIAIGIIIYVRRKRR